MSKLETCWRRPSGRAERGSRGFILHVDRELLDLLNNFDAEICKVWSHSRPDAKPLLETGLHLCVSMVRVWHRPGSKPMFAWVLQVREVELVVVARARAEQGRSSLPQIRGNVKCRATYRIELSRRSGRCCSEHGHDEDQAGRARMPTIGKCAPATARSSFVANDATVLSLKGAEERIDPDCPSS